MTGTVAGMPVRIVGWVLVGFIFLPFLVVVPVSLTDQIYIALPKEGLSFKHYAEMLNDASWMTSFGVSAVIAAVVMVLSVIVGTICAFGSSKLPPNQARVVQAAILIPLIVPAVVQGLTFYRAWVDLGISNTYFGVILAHTITSVPFVFITVTAALVNLDPRLETAARNLGANPGQVMRWVTVPAVMPGILSGALFAFVHSFDELIVVLFITSHGVETLPKKMWASLEDDLTPVIACVAVVLGFVTLALLMLELALRRRADARAVKLSRQEV